MRNFEREYRRESDPNSATCTDTRRSGRGSCGGGAAWYEAEKPGLGSDFFNAVEAAMDLVEEDILPLLTMTGEAGIQGAKRIILKRFPYDIVAIERSHEILVIAIAHHSRKPGYWRDRIKSS